MLYEQRFFFSLLLTLVIEVPIVVLFVRYLYKYQETKISQVILISLVASTLTLPYFWFVLPAYIVNRTIYIVVGEFLVILVEAIFYNQLLNLKLLQAIIVSLIANIVSILFGLMLQ